MSSSALSIAESHDQVNMWSRIIELQPVISKCARKMAFVYDEDAGDLEHDMMLALLDKTRETPALLDKPMGYIFQTLKNYIHSAHRSKIQASNLDDERMACDDSQADELACQERITGVRHELEHMDAECRELVKAIMENGDLIRDNRRKRSNRPCRNTINVNALAARMGKPKSSIYRDVERVRMQLAPVIA